jgi:ribonucleotide monophosphatase NagD (HAD superfamily)
MVIRAGSIAQRYAQLGGKVSFVGKPEPAIYDEALRRAAALTGRDIPKSRLLAIGDGLATDIKGAADTGFDAYCGEGGLHAQEAVNRIKNRFLGLNLVGVSDRLSWT